MLCPTKLKGILFDRTVVPVVSFITVKLLEWCLFKCKSNQLYSVTRTVFESFSSS